MEYERLNLKNGTVLNEDHLRHFENGIEAALDGAKWELVGEVISDGTGDSVGIYVPIDFTQYKEVFITTLSAANTACRVLLCSALAWYSGTIMQTVTNSNAALLQTLCLNINGVLFPFTGWNAGYTNSLAEMMPNHTPRDTMLETDYTYVRVDTNNSGAVPEGVTLTVYGRK